jgi:hypothetical protein
MTEEDLAARVAALEATVGDLLAGKATPPQPAPPTAAAAEDPDKFWVLAGLKRRVPDGAVVLAGDVPLPTGERVGWQWGRTTADLLDSDWSEPVPALVALAHPVRLRLLHRVLTGTHAVAELSDDAEMGTTGQLYHHLRQLVSAGWLRSAGRGRYVVPGERVVPLLVILMGAQR